MTNIELINFKCYEYLKISFKSKTNLLIGDNSSGKTTIIKAISYALNSFFSGFSDDNTRFVGLSKYDFTEKMSSTGFINDSPITVNFDLLGKSAQLVLNTEKGSTQRTPLYPISNYARELQETLFKGEVQVKPLPLFASFSTEDIHSVRKLSMTPFTEYYHKPSFGYYECLQGDGFFPYWTKRLLVLKEGGKGKIELSCVQQAIQRALGNDGCGIINDMEIRHNQSKVYYHFTDGREVSSENLSDGYKRLVNMVTDLAFRCALLNQGIYGEEACLKTTGTVLIDEVDLHLHPTLQSVVIQGLRFAFPELRFIVTTHAPMVMTSIKSDDDNIIYKLDYSKENGYSAIPVDLYGMDASTIIDVALDTTPRSKEVDDRLNTLFHFIDIDDYPNALKILTEMKDEFGDNLPDLAKAQAMLNFLTEDND